MTPVEVLVSDKKKSPAITILLLVLVFCSMIQTYQSFERFSGIDFYQFWVVTQVVGQKGVGNIYSQEERRRIGGFFNELANRLPGAEKLRLVASYRKVLETYSTPFLYSFFRLFASGQYIHDLERFQIFSLLCMCALIGVLGKIYNYSLSAILALIIFGILFDPFKSDVRVANVNQLQLGFMALFLLFQMGSRRHWKHVACGAVLGIMLLFKPNQIFIIWMLLISWFAHRQYGRLLLSMSGMAMCAVAIFLLTNFHWGTPWCWMNWLLALKDIPGDIITVELGNFSLTRLWLDMQGKNISLILTVILVVVSSTLVWLGARPGLTQVEFKDEVQQDARMMAVGSLIYLLSAPLVWLHYYLTVIPIIMVLLRPSTEFRQSRTWWFIMTLTMFGFVQESWIGLFNFLNIRDMALIIIESTMTLYILAHLEMWSLIVNAQDET